MASVPTVLSLGVTPASEWKASARSTGMSFCSRIITVQAPREA